MPGTPMDWELNLLEYPTEDTSSNVVDAIDTGTSDKTEERHRQGELTDLRREKYNTG